MQTLKKNSNMIVGLVLGVLAITLLYSVPDVDGTLANSVRVFIIAVFILTLFATIRYAQVVRPFTSSIGFPSLKNIYPITYILASNVIDFILGVELIGNLNDPFQVRTLIVLVAYSLVAWGLYGIVSEMTRVVLEVEERKK